MATLVDAETRREGASVHGPVALAPSRQFKATLTPSSFTDTGPECPSMLILILPRCIVSDSDEMPRLT